MKVVRVVRMGGTDRWDFGGNASCERMASRIASYSVSEFGGREERVNMYDSFDRTIPSGLFERISEAFEKSGVRVVSAWASGTREGPDQQLRMEGDIRLRDYQEEAVRKAFKARHGVLRMATGSGKTFVACKLIEEINRKTYFLVHTKDVLEQTFDALGKWFGSRRIGIRGGGMNSFDKSIVVATMQSASRFVEDDLDDMRKADCVFVDECHRVAAPVASYVMSKLPATWRYGLSASPWRDDGADMAIEGAVGPLVVEVSASKLAEMGWLATPVIRMLEAPSPLTMRRMDYNKKYDLLIVENNRRNDMIADEASDMFRRGLSLLVVVRKIHHGKKILDLLRKRLGFSPPFIHGSCPMTFRNEVLDKLRRKKIRLAIASSIADEGLDVPALDGMVLAGGGKSSTKALQRIGRALRTGEVDPFDEKERFAEIVDFMDEERTFRAHSMARMKMYQTEPGWIVTDV